MLDVNTDTAFGTKILDAIAMRARVAMHNLVNKNTPGYKRYVVLFEDDLREAMKNGGDFEDVHPRMVRDESGGPEDNTVSEYEELALLEKTRALHEIFSRRLGGYFHGINKAIRGRV